MSTTSNPADSTLLPHTNPRANLLWVGNWPIWLRMALGLTLITVLPMAATFTVVQNEVGAVDQANLEAYVIETGEQRHEDVSDFLQRAADELTFLASNTGYAPELRNLLRFNRQLTAGALVFTNYVDDRLISTRLFSDVRLLDLDGLVVASSDERGTNTPAVEPGFDESGTVVYQEVQNAITLQQDQRTIVSITDDGEALLQQVQIIYDGSGEPVGFLAAMLDSDQVLTLLDNEEGDFIAQLRSYIVTDNNQIIGPADLREAASPGLASNPVSRAFAGRSGVADYTIGDEGFLAYYAPVTSDNRFAVVTETPADTRFTLALTDLYEDGVVIVIAGAVLAVLVGAVITLTITGPLGSLQQDIMALDNGEFDRPVQSAERGDEIGMLARGFVNTREQLRELLANLEDRLQARSQDMQSTQAVSRYAATQRDLQVLMDQVVTLVVDRFPNIYHAQIFLIDSNREYAVLRASTGEAGQQLLKRGHRLEVGGVSVIGQVTEEARVVIARDTSESEIHRRNEFLLDTRAELAIPLRIGQRVIGALDVQSMQSDSFTDEQVRILQTMSDQIAIAIENARLYQESVQRLREVALNNQEATLYQWQQHISGRRQRAIVSAAGTQTEVDSAPLREAAIRRGDAAIGAVTSRDTVPFAVPIQLRGQTLGAVEWEVRASEFSEDRVALAQELVNRLAVSLDNARLFQESQQAINRERLVNEIAARLTAQTDIDEILQTAVRNVGQALRAPQVSIKLNYGPAENDSEPYQNGSNGHADEA